ncbi:hypothetical protein BvCmsHHP016_03350 [Escherichia coli]|nr:hypothetical protein BvCmsHHP016_03350 [Escherichia coli]
MVNILANQVDIGTGIKHGGSIQASPHRLRFTTENIGGGTAVSMCDSETGKQIQSVQLMFFVDPDLNVRVVVTETTTGRAGTAHDACPCTGFAVDVTQVTHTFVQVVDLVQKRFIVNREQSGGIPGCFLVCNRVIACQ